VIIVHQCFLTSFGFLVGACWALYLPESVSGNASNIANTPCLNVPIRDKGFLRSMMKYLIWDFEGTLGHRLGMWSGALVEVLQQEMPASRATADDLRPYLQTGFPWHHPEKPRAPHTTAEGWWVTLLPVFERAFRCGAGLQASEARRLAHHVREVYLNPTRWHVFDDTLPCLHALSSQGWQHVVLSNHVPELPAIIKALGLTPYIMQVFNSAQTGCEKPHPQAFHNVLTVLHRATQICMVGDNVQADIVGAQAVGLQAVLVRSQHPQAEHCCETLVELPSVLSSISRVCSTGDPHMRFLNRDSLC
jgi:putative hydrolase of the HAD superfamily